MQWLDGSWLENVMLLLLLLAKPSVLWRCWLGGRKGIRPVKTEWWGADVAICLEHSADLREPSWCHCHSLSLASGKSRLVLPFWYRLTWVVPDKGPLNGCMYVCMLLAKHRLQRDLRFSSVAVALYTVSLCSGFVACYCCSRLFSRQRST